MASDTDIKISFSKETLEAIQHFRECVDKMEGSKKNITSIDKQVDLLSQYITREFPDNVTECGAIGDAITIIGNCRKAFEDIMQELITEIIIPGAVSIPIVNAYNIAKKMLI
jgi:hypothetical protein